MKGIFRISPPIKIGPDYFTHGRKKEGQKSKLTGIKACMDAGTADSKQLRSKFWENVEKTLTDVYGQRKQNRRKYQNEHGCYIFTWGTTPFYIGQTTCKNGFYGECFEKKHKLTMLRKYISPKKVVSTSLYLYLVFWDGKQNAQLGEIVDHMETYLITKAIDEGFYFELMNDKKTSHKWVISGFREDPEIGCTLPTRGQKKTVHPSSKEFLILIPKRRKKKPHNLRKLSFRIYL